MEEYAGKSIPKLGFGLMRLPRLGEDVDMAETGRMVDLFLQHGYTYFDTAWGYMNGRSEEAAKEALVDRYPREKFQLATKLPAYMGKTAQEAKDMLATSLRRTGAGYFDFYLLHNLGGERTRVFEDYGIWEYLAQQKKEGVIRHLGFSFHANAEHLDEVLTRHPEADFVQLQINYADWENGFVQSRKNYEVARRHQKPVIIMEPVKGGTLAEPPPAVAALLRGADPNASLASWALRFAAGLPGLVTVLSGMSNMEQMEDNLRTMDDFRPLDGEERAVIARAQAIFAALPSIPCTDCRYCADGCPKNLDIPNIFKAMNAYLMFDDLEDAKMSYGWATEPGERASDCIACGKCEKVCPQGIVIIQEMKRAAELFDAL